MQPGPAPTPSQAQCPTCKQTFSGVTLFDRHRIAGVCRDPRGMKGVRLDRRGVWRRDEPHPLSVRAAERRNPPPACGVRG